MAQQMADAARARFEMENNIQAIDADKIYKYDKAAVDAFLSTRPWKTDPHYFKHVKMSAVALLKMVMHARAGGNIEVMGLMMGKVEGTTMIVTDSFALPVEGTETRVNAQAEGYEYMVDYIDLIKQVGRPENALGWYHSHPSYGAWLSGIDVSTQMLNQQYQEPWLAVVVDPTRTVSAGKVEIGAFRTFPAGYKNPDAKSSEYQTIPLNKIEDFGAHADSYYPLEMSFYKSSLDTVMLEKLWNKYWVNTLSSSPIFTNRDYVALAIHDLSDKLEQAETALNHSGRMGGFGAAEKKKEESQLSKLTKDSAKMTIEQTNGMMAEVMKDILFNHRNQV